MDNMSAEIWIVQIKYPTITIMNIVKEMKITVERVEKDITFLKSRCGSCERTPVPRAFNTPGKVREAQDFAHAMVGVSSFGTHSILIYPI